MVFMTTTGILMLLACVAAKFDPIAFTVEEHSSSGYTGVQTLSFSQVLTVHNNLTNIFRGVFTCTRAGYYKFQVYANSDDSSKVFLDMYGNDTALASLYGYTTKDTEIEAAGNAVIVYLRVGDTMRVKTRGTFPMKLYYYKTNTFTGVELGSAQRFASPENPHVLAFSVVSSTHQHISGGEAVLYHKKLVDDRDDFILDKGTYVSPSSGYYIIHPFSMSWQGEELWLDLRKNRSSVCSIYALRTYEWAAAGNTVILHLIEGDNLMVTAHDGIQNHLYGASDHIFTTFSGALIISDTDLSSPVTFYEGRKGTAINMLHSEAHGTVPKLDSEMVLFSVGLSKNATLSSGDPVLFDTIFANVRGSYSISTGLFTAPFTGSYEFNYHAVSSEGQRLNLRLKASGGRNNEILTDDRTHRSTSGNAAVLELAGGDTVGIISLGTSYLTGGRQQIFCTFSGYLLSNVGPSVVVGK